MTNPCLSRAALVYLFVKIRLIEAESAGRIKRRNLTIQIGSHVAEPDTFAYRKDIVSTNSKQDNLKHSAFNTDLFYFSV